MPQRYSGPPNSLRFSVHPCSAINQEQKAFDRHAASLVWSDYDLVFCDVLSGPLSTTKVTKPFQRAAEAAGLLVSRFHALRHMAASILLATYVHVKLVSEMLAHSTITLTLDTYSHVIPAMHSDAAAAMDAVFTA